MKEIAMVEALQPTEKSGLVLLKKVRPEACHSCSSRVLCGVKNEFSFKALNEIDEPLCVGDLVEFSLPQISVSKIAFLVYGIPLIIFLGVLFLMAGVLKTNEYVAVLISLASLFGTYVATAFYDKKVFRNSEAALPKIIRKI